MADFEKFEAFERPPVGASGISILFHHLTPEGPGGFVPSSELPPQPFHQFVESFTNVGHTFLSTNQ